LANIGSTGGLTAGTEEARTTFGSTVCNGVVVTNSVTVGGRLEFPRRAILLPLLVRKLRSGGPLAPITTGDLMQRFGLSRRTFLAASSALLLNGHTAVASPIRGFAGEIQAARDRIGGRLGLHVLDTHTGGRWSFDDGSRYAMASTFKMSLAAAILQRTDLGAISLDEQVKLQASDMLSHAPVTSKHLGKGAMTVRELCAAVVEASDNPAANLLLKMIDGPAGLTRFFRSLGDRETRLDRYELDLNSNLPGDLRDTTTPRAMVHSMEQVLTKEVLSPISRELLLGWMINASTGLKMVRQGLPAQWKVGDKTGRGANGAVNDLVITWPPGRKPVLMALYLRDSKRTAAELSAVHAEIGGIVAREVLRT
jgi:beta-lactamase class A